MSTIDHTSFRFMEAALVPKRNAKYHEDDPLDNFVPKNAYFRDDAIALLFQPAASEHDKGAWAVYEVVPHGRLKGDEVVYNDTDNCILPGEFHYYLFHHWNIVDGIVDNYSQSTSGDYVSARELNEMLYDWEADDGVSRPVWVLRTQH